MDVAILGALLVGGSAGTFFGVLIATAAQRVVEREKER